MNLLRNTIPPGTTKSGTVMTSTGDASQEDSIDQPPLGPDDINQDQLFQYLLLTDKDLILRYNQ
jgi:hypothetical protein